MKLSVSTLVRAYGRNGTNREQLEAIEHYTRKHTITHSIATFLTLFKGGNRYKALIRRFQRESFTSGFAAVVISVAGNERIKA
ncbi:MAG: hypothetical protein R3C10_23415 [Pirellulales bacterium]